ncbi:MAG: gamma carbonic anhydrase family protein, partial [Actinomycetes bacterium]|nr:gamma carbonic anhydrase family protein [Actinomycetes bacterium]
MIVRHRGKAPTIDPTATVSPSAVVSGDVTLGPGVRVLHGAVLTAENGRITVGEDVVIMENAVVKGRAGHDVVIGDSVVIGPHVHVNGATVGDECF